MEASNAAGVAFGYILCQPVAQKGSIGLLFFDILVTIVTAVVFFVVFETAARFASLHCFWPGW